MKAGKPALLVGLSATLIVACIVVAQGRENVSASGAAVGTPAVTTATAGVPTTTTVTTAPRTTTSAPPVLRPSLADADRAIAAWTKSREGIVEVAIGSLDNAKVKDVTPVPAWPVRIASVIKVSIAISFLRLRHEQGRAPSRWELSELREMIVESDNDAAESLWDASGGSDGLRVIEQAARLANTAFQPGHGWGFTLTTAHDQAQVESALARGRMLPPAETLLVLSLMRSVERDQRWGFADSLDPALLPAIKNGWYEDRDASVWRVHCTAVFDSPRLAHRFSIAVLTRYPAHLGIDYGEDTCDGVAHRLGAWLTLK